MGMEFENLKKNSFPTDLPTPEKQGRVRGNKNIFKVGLKEKCQYALWFQEVVILGFVNIC